MIPDAHAAALRVILERLGSAPFGWALTGSLGMALQGLPVTPRDIDLQTDEAGAYGVPDALAEFVTAPVRVKESARLRSLWSELEIHGVAVEVMGEMQHRRPDGSLEGAWDAPVELPRVKRWARWGAHYVPVLSIAHEAAAYAAMGRPEKAAVLAEWAAAHPEDRPEEISNYRRISANLATGGQPLPGQIAALGQAGYTALINLAWPESHYALSGEAEMARAAGLEYLPVPVEFGRPTRENLERFFALLEARRDRAVFAHCVLNFRVSSFVYLYRVLRLGEDPARARADLESVWTPEPVWERFIAEMGETG